MKSINRITALNIASTIILQGILFFTTPIFTRLLGSEQYGLYAVFNSWVSILTCIVGFGIASTIGNGMYEFKEKYKQFRSSVLMYGTISCVVLGAIIIMFTPLVGNKLGYGFELLLLMILISSANYVISFFQATCIYERKAFSNFIVSILLSVSTAGFSILFIVNNVFVEKYLGRVYGYAIPYIVMSVILWIYLILEEKPVLDKRYLRFVFYVGFPIVFHSLAHNILGQSDRVMMQMFGISNSDIGIYSLYYSFTMILSTVLSALNTSWCSFYYEYIDAKAWEMLNIKCKNYIELFSVLAIGFLLLSREVSYIMADETFHSGINLIPVLVCAVYFTFMYQFPVNFEFFHKKTNVIAIGTIFSGLCNIILNALMIPHWEIYGAAFATTLSYGALFVMHYIIAKRMKEHSFHLNAIQFLPGLGVVICGIVFFYVLSDFWLIRWGMGIAVGLWELRRIVKRRTII